MSIPRPCVGNVISKNPAPIYVVCECVYISANFVINFRGLQFLFVRKLQGGRNEA